MRRRCCFLETPRNCEISSVASFPCNYIERLNHREKGGEEERGRKREQERDGGEGGTNLLSTCLLNLTVLLKNLEESRIK